MIHLIHLPYQRILRQMYSVAQHPFSNISVYQGIFLTKQFLYDGSLDQRFILNNSFIDTSTLKVYISTSSSTQGIEYSLSENILMLIAPQEYSSLMKSGMRSMNLRFGDGLIGRKLGEDDDGTYITANYIVTDGRDGNGSSTFSFSGTLESSVGSVIDPGTVTITTTQASINRGDIGLIDSVKYYAPDCIPRSIGQLQQGITRSNYPENLSQYRVCFCGWW